VELELRGITKRFGPLVANDGISLSVAPGQVHALLGENGAGKTTLMNVLFGLTRPDQGEIHIDGKAASFRSPKDAIAAGIGMVHQHFMLVPVFTVAENVIPATVTQLVMDRVVATSLIDTRKPQRTLLSRSSIPKPLLECPSTLLCETSARSHPMCHRSLHSTSMAPLQHQFYLLFEYKSPLT